MGQTAWATSRDTQAKYRDAGKCIQCGQRKPVTATLCRACLTKHNVSTKALIARNLEAGRCRQCGKGPLVSATLCSSCLTKHNAYSADYKRRKRAAAKRSARA